MQTDLVIEENCSLRDCNSFGLPAFARRLVRVTSEADVKRLVDGVREATDAVLAELYRRASAVVQYSLYEGFDLPLAEALACGAPVAVSELEVHHEVAGECGVYARPDRPAELARAVLDVLGWPKERRRSHADAAARRVTELRREDPIGRHLEVYERVLEEGAGRTR